VKYSIGVRRAVERMRAYNPPLEGRVDRLRLDFNENPIGCSPAVRRSLARLSANVISAYPEQDGLRAKAAKFFGVDKSSLLLTNGTDEALSLVVSSFLEPGERVLLVEPTYAMYRFYSELAGAQVEAPRYDAAMRFPWKDVLKALARGPKIFFLPNPNSPTGHLLSLVDLKRILGAAKRTMVVIDEAYFEFSGVTVIPWIRRQRNLIVTRTFSKAAGLAGLRLGCIFVHHELAAAMRRAQSPYPVNAAALVAAEAAMRDRAFIARTVREVRRGRRELERGLTRLGIGYFPSGGNFVLANFGDRAHAKTMVAALARKGTLVRDRSGDFNGEGYVRITVGTPGQMRRLLRELRDIL
jgi:histidinol-phosphate aminotransferase